MYLEKVSIYGFKTFRKDTEILLSPKITCIVGPNGSGKSNIVDGIRWALGEQRLSLLRASNATDLIFSGSAFKKPLNVASVKLVFNNEDRTFPHVNTPRVIVERRIYRSKESGYFVNNNPMRLQDVMSLFYSAGMYNHMYSIVNQGRVEEILLAKPEQKRVLIEQVAGVEVFKKKRKEALKKLDETEQNLLRVKDILNELKKRTNRIVNEAKKAHMYYFLNDRLKQLESTLLNYTITNLKREIETIKSGIKDIENEENAIIEKIRAKKEELYKAEKEKEEISKELNALREKKEKAKIEEAKLKEKELYLEEKKERTEEKINETTLITESNTRKTNYIQADLKKAKSLAEKLQTELTEKRERVSALKQKTKELENEIAPLIEKEKERKTFLQKLQNERIVKERTLSSMLSEINYLEKEKSKTEFTVREAEKAEIKEPSQIESKINELLALISEKESQRQKISEEIALLKYRINEAERFIREHESGGRQFKNGTLGSTIPLARTGMGIEDELGAFILEKSSELRSKRKGHFFIKENLIPLKETRTPKVVPITDTINSPYLKGIYVSETLADGTEFFKNNAEHLFIKEIITKDGFVLFSPFEVKINSSLLIEEKKRIVAELNKEKSEKEKQVSKLSEEINNAKQTVKNLQKELENAERKLAEKKKALMLKPKIKALESEINEKMQAAEAIKAEIEKLMSKMERADTDARLAEKRRTLEQLKNELHNALISFKDTEFKLETVQKDISQMTMRLEGTQKNIERLKKEKLLLEEELKKTVESLYETEKAHNKIKLDLAEFSEKEKELGEKIDATDREIKRINLEIARMEEQKENLLRKMEKQHVSLAEKNAQIKSALERMREKDIKEREIAYNVDTKKIRLEISSLKAKINSLGAIDFTSVEEEESIKEELKKKESVYNDVLSSKKELELFISEMEKRAHEEFEKTLSGVEKYFSVFFRRMFKGGEATIGRILDERNDVKGIELNVRLPGKKKQSLPLLSGGEKSLTALAFLFAIFKVKPAPFYVLDEVDAALDEENVVKFGELLSEESDFAQFIVITHNKETMQKAHLLYGITMEEDGVSKVVSLKLV